jgi:hypothetical protein
VIMVLAPVVIAFSADLLQELLKNWGEIML